MGTAPIGHMNDWHWMDGPNNTLAWIEPECIKCKYLIVGAKHSYKCNTKECPAQKLKPVIKRWLNKHIKYFDSKGNYKGA